MPDYIRINHEKLCDCPNNHLSCIDAKGWLQNQIGLWQFSYGPKDIKNKEIHPATYPISLAQKVIEQYTHEGELVLDPFSGSGTTLIAAQRLNRNALGFDLNQRYVDLANSRLRTLFVEDGVEQRALCGDARLIGTRVEPNTVKLLLTSPPYANCLNRPCLNKSRHGDKRINKRYKKVEQYSQDERDLGILNEQDFEKAIFDIFAGIKPVLKSNAHAVVNIADIYVDGKTLPLHIDIINAMQRCGYELRNVIIWDKTNLLHNIGIFGWPSNYITIKTMFEYILDFVVSQPSSDDTDTQQKN